MHLCRLLTDVRVVEGLVNSSCVFQFLMCRWWWIPATAELIILSCMSPYLRWIPSKVPRDVKLNHLRQFLCEFSFLAVLFGRWRHNDGFWDVLCTDDISLLLQCIRGQILRRVWHVFSLHKYVAVLYSLWFLFYCAFASFNPQIFGIVPLLRSSITT
jgi:hypothetical protein